MHGIHLQAAFRRFPEGMALVHGNRASVHQAVAPARTAFLDALGEPES